MPNGLSEAGLRFGEAFCVPEDMMGTPFDQLPADIQQCVRRVGEGWQKRVEERLGGVGTGSSDVVLRIHMDDHPIGTLSLTDGLVNLCLPQFRCEEIGHGMDGLNAAARTLEAMGFKTELLSGQVPGAEEGGATP
jgi:hypothetical protein